MQRIVSKSEFSRRVGISPGVATRLCKKTLLEAMVGNKIDINHSVAKKYFKDHDQRETSIIDPLYEEVVQWCYDNENWSIGAIRKQFIMGYTRAKKMKAMFDLNGIKQVNKKKVTGKAAALVLKKKEVHKEVLEVPEELEQFLDYTLKNLIDKFGTDVRFLDWLNATQKIEAINEKRLKNEATRGNLIARTLVKSVIDIINSAHLRMMKDGAKSITSGVISKQKSGAELAEIENYATDIIGSFIKPIKSKLERVLKDA